MRLFNDQQRDLLGHVVLSNSAVSVQRTDQTRSGRPVCAHQTLTQLRRVYLGLGLSDLRCFRCPLGFSDTLLGSGKLAIQSGGSSRSRTPRADTVSIVLLDALPYGSQRKKRENCVRGTG
jgi:hypothetical protein